MCFILDTGASPTVVNWTTVGDLKLGFYKMAKPGKDFEAAIMCGMGNSPAGYIQGLRATCGGLPLKHTALTTDMANISLSFGHRVDGLLGTDFLRDKILTINFATHTLNIEQAPGTDNVFTRIIDDIPFARHDAVFVNITTPSSKRPLVFLVDTGASHCIIDSEVAKRINLSLGTERIMNVLGGHKVAHNANDFVGSFGGHRLPSKISTLDLSRASWSLAHNIDGILGMDFMENYTVRINFHTRQMQLQSN